MTEKLRGEIEEQVNLFCKNEKTHYCKVELDNTHCEEGRVMGRGTIKKSWGKEEHNVEISYIQKIIDGKFKIEITGINKTH